jgi:hypothetical protein
MRPSLLLTLMLALPAAYAQNKCVGENGRVTYQQDPCPGAQRSTKPRPYGPVTAPQTPAAPSASASNELRAQVAELERCAGGWEGMARSIESRRQPGQEEMARFLPVCGAYGFKDPKDSAAIVGNNLIAQGLRRRQESLRAEIDALDRKEEERRQAPARAAREAWEARQRENCAQGQKHVDDGRAQLPKLPAEKRADAERRIAAAQAEVDRECRK